jgi:hypothetical protein
MRGPKTVPPIPDTGEECMESLHSLPDQGSTKKEEEYDESSI